MLLVWWFLLTEWNEAREKMAGKRFAEDVPSPCTFPLHGTWSAQKRLVCVTLSGFVATGRFMDAVIPSEASFAAHPPTTEPSRH